VPPSGEDDGMADLGWTAVRVRDLTRGDRFLARAFALPGWRSAFLRKRPPLFSSARYGPIGKSKPMRRRRADTTCSNSLSNTTFRSNGL